MNLKIKGIITLIVLNFSFLSSQKLHTGTINYDLYMPHPTHPKLEKSYLVFNDSVSIFVYRKSGINNFQNKIDQSDVGNVIIRTSNEDEFGSIVYRNFKTNEIVFRMVTTKIYNAKLVNDDWVNLNWEIKNQTKEINNFKCQKAVTKFRGRNYIAWFTTEIPLRYGPWKLYGLPGLILEAYDSKNEFYAIANNIKYPVLIDDGDFVKPTNGEILTLEQFIEFQEKIPELTIKKIASKMPKGTIMHSQEFKTNFIELNFE